MSGVQYGAIEATRSADQRHTKARGRNQSVGECVDVRPLLRSQLHQRGLSAGGPELKPTGRPGSHISPTKGNPAQTRDFPAISAFLRNSFNLTLNWKPSVTLYETPASPAHRTNWFYPLVHFHGGKRLPVLPADELRAKKLGNSKQARVIHGIKHHWHLNLE